MMLSIFNKALDTKIYSSFYGELCQNIINEELQKRNVNLKDDLNAQKQSRFFVKLINHCKAAFKSMINEKKSTEDEEEATK